MALMTATLRVRAERKPHRHRLRKDSDMSAPFVWYDLTASPAEADRVREFYAELFGWPIAPDSNPGPYNGLMMDGEQPWAAVVEATDASAGHWVPYVKVDDLEKATTSATALGGRIVAG